MSSLWKISKSIQVRKSLRSTTRASNPKTSLTTRETSDMDQLDLFNLVDEENISFYIVYLDEDHVLKRSEQLTTTKSNLYKTMGEWCQAHKNYRFCYYKSNKNMMEED